MRITLSHLRRALLHGLLVSLLLAIGWTLYGIAIGLHGIGRLWPIAEIGGFLGVVAGWVALISLSAADRPPRHWRTSLCLGVVAMLVLVWCAALEAHMTVILLLLGGYSPGIAWADAWRAFCNDALSPQVLLLGGCSIGPYAFAAVARLRRLGDGAPLRLEFLGQSVFRWNTGSRVDALGVWGILPPWWLSPGHSRAYFSAPRYPLIERLVEGIEQRWTPVPRLEILGIRASRSSSS